MHNAIDLLNPSINPPASYAGICELDLEDERKMWNYFRPRRVDEVYSDTASETLILQREHALILTASPLKHRSLWSLRDHTNVFDIPLSQPSSQRYLFDQDF